ncbi:hypothetical protein [Candidatus Solirubrobacter pratensis]|uniref:hypothetical protein n=1 Tax=Candidatus Solirubrobacter pratensis TaxID=1298857 RepID=UPI00040FC084|nr:hypothetical protein [Candidatus Solirubrobacter pratensis]
MHAKWVVAVAALGAAMPPAAASAAPGAPGAPGAVANWTRGDKEGFGTSTTTAGKTWFTLAGGELSEVYAPDLGTPSLRDLQFVVSDGATFTERETGDAVQRTELADPRSLTYRQVDTARSGRWRITETYVTDPDRSTVLVDVTFESLTGRPYRLYALADPALSNTGDDDRGAGMTAWDAKGASAIAADPPFSRASSSYMGASDGWTDLETDHRTGLKGSRHLTLALAFGASPATAATTAAASLRTGFGMLPEQVWDDRPPAGRTGFEPGTGTGSATPLGWTHAQLIRLAWSLDAGRPVERPATVACRYAGACG